MTLINRVKAFIIDFIIWLYLLGAGKYFADSFDFDISIYFSVIYAPLIPDTPIAIDPATPALIMTAGSFIWATYAPITTPSIVKAPSKAFMTKYLKCLSNNSNHSCMILV